MVESLLQQGIAAVRAGNMASGRKLLIQVVQTSPDNVAGWLWLAVAVTDLSKKEACLKKVLALVPDHAQAKHGLETVQRQITEKLVSQAEMAADQGAVEQARELFLKVVARDEENVLAWLWLSRLVETSEDQVVALENVLALDPENAEAAEKLALLQQAQTIANENIWASPHDEPKAESEYVGATLAADVLGEDYRQQHTTIIPEPEPEPESPVEKIWVKYDDETRCPSCGAPTDLEDRHCATCHTNLWLKTRRREKRSLFLWVLIGLQAINCVWTISLPFVFVAVLSLMLEVDFSALLSLYTGGGNDAISPETTMLILETFPRILFFIAWIPTIVSATLLTLLYIRWPPVFYLMVISSVLSLLGSAVSVVFSLSQGGMSIVFAIVGAGFALVELILILQLEDDFLSDRHRILLRVDKGLSNGVSYLLRGRKYAAQQWWALAALHFRRAAALLPYQTDGHIGVAIACVHMKEYDLARHALEKAREIEPNEPKIASVLAMLEDENSL